MRPGENIDWEFILCISAQWHTRWGYYDDLMEIHAGGRKNYLEVKFHDEKTFSKLQTLYSIQRIFKIYFSLDNRMEEEGRKVFICIKDHFMLMFVWSGAVNEKAASFHFTSSVFVENLISTLPLVTKKKAQI
jgi:hypothetical protein